MDWSMAGLLLIVVVMVLFFMGMPVAVALGLTSLLFLIGATGYGGAMHSIAAEFRDFWSSYFLLPIPLFVFMGQFLVAGGTAKDIFEMCGKWLRRLPGGLAIVTVGSCAVFASLSGSSLSAVATFSTLAVPEMLKKGYSKRLATGVVCAAGSLAHIIPPSLMAVIYASLTDLSVGRMLIAGVIPGIILALGYGVTCSVWAWKYPQAAPTEPPATWGERFGSLRHGGVPVLLIILMMGAMYSGAATVTEAAGLGALAAFLVALASRRLTWPVFQENMAAALKTTSFVLFIAVAGKMLSWVLTFYMIPQHLVQIMTDASVNGFLLVVIMQIVYIIMGCFIDGIGMTVITVPIIVPIITALGFDPIWYGILLFINLEMALVTPPLGLNLYIVRGVRPDVPFGDIVRGSLVFMIPVLAVLALVLFYPPIAYWLPYQMMGK